MITPEEVTVRIWRRRSAGSQDPASLAVQERTRALSEMNVGLLFATLEFVLEDPELRTRAFLTEVNRATRAVTDAGRAAQVRDASSRVLAEIRGYARRQHAYIDDREHELKRAAKALTDALADLGTDDDRHLRLLVSHGQRLEQASRLSDLRDIRRALADEVDRLKAVVRERQHTQVTRAAALSARLGELQVRLLRAAGRAEMDPVTGLPNRAALERKLDEVRLLRRFGDRPCSFFLVAVDGGDALRERLGRLAADAWLSGLARAVRGAFRDDDFVARAAGDDFLAVVWLPVPAEALDKAEAVRRAVERTEVEVEGVGTVKVTASIGIAWLHPDEGPDAAVQRAERALGEARRRGGNRVAGEIEVEPEPDVESAGSG